MPPLKAKRLLFRMAVVSKDMGDNEDEQLKLLFVDVKKAHLNGKLKDDAWALVVLPEEAGGGVARLRRWLYDMRPAANAWESDYAENLKGVGFIRGAATPTVFFNPETKVRLAVHGDDFTFLGPALPLKKLEDQMSSWYQVKVRGLLGPEVNDKKIITILNRSLEWKTEGIEYRADEKHVKKIMEELG
jgi:hypothetical protein